jgi:glycerophosphoryl diester phosphodiesterase
MGVDMVEFDVRLSADGYPVLIHSDELHETTNGHGRVSQTPLADLRRLDAGRGQRIPTLEEALDLLAHKVLLNIDLKVLGCEEAVVRALHAYGLRDEVIISSLMPENLRTVHTLDPGIFCSISYPEDKGGVSRKPYLKPIVAIAVRLMRVILPWRIIGMMHQATAQGTMLNHQVVTRTVVDVVHNWGGLVCTWTVDDLATMRRLCAWGVDGIASNRPDLFAYL